ncbi:MAG TPA: Xaa-Pro peptidase family protein [Armatimonadota bacterium]|jgi:Xaa-Pro aminopeptidase
MTARLAKLRDLLSQDGAPALLITNLENVRYLSGFTGSAGAVLVTSERALFFADPRYHDQARQQCPDLEIICYEGSVDRLEAIAQQLAAHQVKALRFEAAHLSYSEAEKTRKTLAGVELEPSEDLVERLRQVKDADEVEAIRRAVTLVDRAYSHILTKLAPKMSERDVALELDFFMRRNGADKEGFDTIAASGPNSAYPHHHPGSRLLQRGDLVKMDFGAYMGGYNSDITRTVCLGPATEKQRQVYSVVLGAQLAALAAIRPGVPGRDVDRVARNYIAAHGYGDYFGHGLGHSLGREVHDGPGLSQRSTITLSPGMVVTVEPGIYIEDWGGVRIEDDVLVTEDGAEVLTQSTKELIEI